MMFFLPQGRYPENFMLISQFKVYEEGGSKRGVLGGHRGFLSGEVDDRIIYDILDVLCRPQGSYPESSMALSLLLVEI